MALGQKRTYAAHNGMSALPSKADMCSATINVCFGPIADMCSARADVRALDQKQAKTLHSKLASGHLLFRRPDAFCVLVAFHDGAVVRRGDSVDFSNFRCF